MEGYKSTPATIDEYISQFPPEIQAKLKKLRQVIKEAAPEAQEAIKYQMPTYVLHGNLVHFAAFKDHIGFYPDPTGIDAFQDEIGKHRTAKGTVQFQLDEELPYELISRIVKYRVAENIRNAASKKKK